MSWQTALIFVRDSTIYVASGDRMEVRQRTEPKPTILMRGAVLGLGSWPTAQDCLFAVTDRGSVVLNMSRSRRDRRFVERPFVTREGLSADHLIQPVIRAISSQWVVAAAATGLLVFRADQNQLVPYGELTETTETPVAVLETGHRNQFAVLTVRGQLQLYEIGGAGASRR